MKDHNLLIVPGVAMALALALASSLVPVYAQTPPPPPPFDPFKPVLTEADTNEDGKVSPAEMKAFKTAEFNAMNTNKNDGLTFAEFYPFVTEAQKAKLAALDSDESGDLALAEFNAINPKATKFGTAVFKLLDSNADNALSMEEANVLLPGKGDAIVRFTSIDLNRDLVVSLKEFLPPPPKAGPAPAPGEKPAPGQKPAPGKGPDQPPTVE
jgi:hypothetical protein